MINLPAAVLATTGLFGIAGGAGGGYYLQSQVGVPVWVHAALSTQHDDNAALYQRIEEFTKHFDQLATQLVSQQNSQQAGLETLLRRIDARFEDMAQRNAVRDAAKANFNKDINVEIEKNRRALRGGG